MVISLNSPTSVHLVNGKMENTDTVVSFRCGGISSCGCVSHLGLIQIDFIFSASLADAPYEAYGLV